MDEILLSMNLQSSMGQHNAYSSALTSIYAFAQPLEDESKSLKPSMSCIKEYRQIL